MKKIIITLICGSVMLTLSACASAHPPSNEQQVHGTDEVTNETQIDSPEGIEGMTLLESVTENHSPKAAGDAVMQNMIRISSDEMKGTHDADHVYANGKVYAVYEANNEKPGDPGTYEKEYCALAIIDLESFKVESIEKFAWGEQKYSNVTMLKGSAFVPRVIRKDDNTLRFFFSNIAVDSSSGYIYYVDYDLATEAFDNNAYRLKIMTPNGTVDFSAEVYAELFRADGHACDNSTIGHFLFDIFDVDGTKYIALNNFRGAQNSLAKFNDTYDCVEIIGNIGGSYTEYRTTESGIVQLKDGSWISILRNHAGSKIYSFSYSEDGTEWTDPVYEDFMKTGYTSKPTLDRFGDYYFMGYNDLSRGLFHLAYSLDAKNWTVLYSFHSPTTFQYPKFDIYEGQMYFSVTTGNKEQIYFGKLPIREKDGKLYIEETTCEFESSFNDLSDFTVLCDRVQTNTSGTLWKTYVKRDNEGIYFYAETNGKMSADKLILMLDTVGTATKLGATVSPDNLMIRFHGNSHVQSVYASNTRGYRALASFDSVKFFKHEYKNGTKIGLFLPYTAITEIAPFATPANASSDLYIAVCGAHGSTEYFPVIAGKKINYTNTTTYALFTPSGEITARK